MPSGTKAILAQLIIYLANNNVRRNIGSFVANVQNANSNIIQNTTSVLAAGGTYATGSLPAGNLITVVVTDVPLTANVVLAGGGGFTKVITSMMVLDFEVASITFTNNDPTNNATLFVVNG